MLGTYDGQHHDVVSVPEDCVVFEAAYQPEGHTPGDQTDTNVSPKL